MKVLLVTSQVTYVPRNQLRLLEYLLENNRDSVAGLVLVRTLSFKLLLRIAGLYLSGCWRIANCLLRNAISLPFDKRVKLFKRAGLPVMKVGTMNQVQMIDWIKSNQVDLVVNLRTRCIYSNDLLAAPRLGCINIHHGLLPEYRGTFCDLHALAKGREAGFSIHLMSEHVDAGEILLRQTVSDGSDKDYMEYLRLAGHRESRALSELLRSLVSNGALPAGQPNRCPRPVFNKTPSSRAEIKRLKAVGMVL